MTNDSKNEKMIDFWDYMHKKVKITLKDGEIFIGYPDGFSTWADSSSGDDEIDIDCENGIGYVLERNDIASIEIIEED